MPTLPRPAVVWDMDEVIADLRYTVCPAFSRFFGVPVDWRDWRDYAGFWRHFTTSRERALEALLETQAIETCLPDPEAEAVLRKSAESGFRNVIVTARAWHPDGEGVSWDWLRRHRLDRFVDGLVAVPLDVTKTAAIAALAPVALYVEDSPQHLDAALLSGVVRRAVVVDRPWNEEWRPTAGEVVRVTRLLDVADVLERLAAES